jgi:hypothetical protein
MLHNKRYVEYIYFVFAIWIWNMYSKNVYEGQILDTHFFSRQRDFLSGLFV